MPNYTINDTNLRVEIVPPKGHTIHGGQVAVAAMCKKLGLWQLLRAQPALDRRRDKTRGFSPEVMAAQIILGLCGGGASLADAERLGQDKSLKKILGVRRFADQTQLGEWLRELGEEGAQALKEVSRKLVARALPQCPEPRVRSGGEMEVFFDDTQIEVHGKKIEGAAINYNGDLALGWQVLYAGPFIAEQEVTGDNTPVSEHLGAFVQRAQPLWANTPRYLYADCASSEGKHLDLVKAHFPRWSISYTKWTSPLERTAQEQPARVWQQQGESFHAFIRHMPEGAGQPHLYAVKRWRKPDELFDRYTFCACEESTRAPASVWERHAIKGEREKMFSQLLSDLDLHHPPCLQLNANRAYYTLASIAYNILTALKHIELPDEHQQWRVRSIIRHLLTLPAKLSRHARGLVLRIYAPAGQMNWWRIWQEKHAPG